MPSTSLMMSPAARITRELRERVAAAGFDLLTPLQVGWYNEQVEGSLRLEDFGAPANLAVVIGNTRALWPAFMSALEHNPELLEAEHPLERYVEASIGAAAGALGVTAAVRWSHATGAALVAMQRLAHVAGLASLSETHLSIHPKYGPWIALRAALSFPVSAPELERPDLSHPCADCGVRCVPALGRALASTPGGPLATSVRKNPLPWVALRDSCPVGRAERYGEAQLRYHYVPGRSTLSAALREWSEREGKVS